MEARDKPLSPISEILAEGVKGDKRCENKLFSRSYQPHIFERVWAYRADLEVASHERVR